MEGEGQAGTPAPGGSLGGISRRAVAGGRFASVAALPNLSADTMLNCLADGLYVTDLDRRILFWNRAAERITGWPAGEVVGRTCYDNLLCHVDKDGHALCGQEYCPLHRSIITGQASTSPVLVFALCKCGTRAPVEVSVGPIRDSGGDIVGGIEVFRDLSGGMEDMLRAKTIQVSALDCPLPEDDRLEFEICYHPREIVGGDFYRAERLDADRYAVMVADVMGQGLASALYTMQLRSLWEDHRHDLFSPSRFLTVMNQRLNALVREAGYFATGVCLLYDAANGQIRVVRAGHPPPLLLRADGRIEPMGRPQPALGMVPEIAYTDTTESLAPGDGLLVFTDGAVELINAEDEELGLAGLIRMLGGQDSGSPASRCRLGVLEEELLRYSSEIQLPDDLTLLKILRRR